MRTAVTSPLLLLAFLSGVPLSIYAAPDGHDELKWLEIMAFAAHQINYSGTFVYQYGSHVETSRLTHVVDANGEHGRLEGLDGARREVIRNNGQVWCYYGDHKVKVEPHQGGREFPALLPEQLTLLSENYQVEQAGQGRVAGFQTHTMIFQPKDNLRYVHKVWADGDSGLLLKTEVLDERGAVIEQYAFTQLSIGGNVDRSWIAVAPQEPPPARNEMRHAHSELHRDGLPPVIHHLPVGAGVVPVASGWQVDAMPTGFKKIAEVRRQIPGKEAPVIQMVFSDGLAGISIFIEKSDSDEDDHPDLFSQGIMQVYSKLVDDHLVTVVGEVPPQTVMQIADSIRYAGESK